MENMITCPLCGRIGNTSEDDTLDNWHPYAFRGEIEIGPVCWDHPGHHDDDAAWII